MIGAHWQMIDFLNKGEGQVFSLWGHSYGEQSEPPPATPQCSHKRVRHLGGKWQRCPEQLSYVSLILKKGGHCSVAPRQPKDSIIMWLRKDYCTSPIPAQAWSSPPVRFNSALEPAHQSWHAQSVYSCLFIWLKLSTPTEMHHTHIPI